MMALDAEDHSVEEKTTDGKMYYIRRFADRVAPSGSGLPCEGYREIDYSGEHATARNRKDSGKCRQGDRHVYS